MYLEKPCPKARILVGLQVLSVACGIWHTAAVAGERHSRFGILHTQQVGSPKSFS